MKNVNRGLRGCVAAMFVAGAAMGVSTASADEIAYNNFGPDNGFDIGFVWNIRGTDSGLGAAEASFFRFVAEASGGVTEIVVASRHQAGDNEYWLQIREDDNDQPGAVLSEWLFEAGDFANRVVFIAADGSFEIEEGDAYWYGIMPSETAGAQWHRNEVGDTGTRWIWEGPGVWTQGSGAPPAKGTLRILVSADDPCPPDWNGDGVVDSDDLFDFLADWAAGDADYNGDGVTDSDDLFEFLSDWADGC